MSFLLPEAVPKTGINGLLFLTDRSEKDWGRAPAAPRHKGLELKISMNCSLKFCFHEFKLS